MDSAVAVRSVAVNVSLEFLSFADLVHECLDVVAVHLMQNSWDIVAVELFQICLEVVVLVWLL